MKQEEMPNTNSTLTSLAILKVNIDDGRDYLEYLAPFIYDYLLSQRPPTVTSEPIVDYLLEEYGLVIPSRTIQVVLRRLAKRRIIAKKHGVYTVVDTVPDVNMSSARAKARRDISITVNGVIAYANANAKKCLTDEQAVAAICAFLSEFDVACLKSYLRGTTIPAQHRDGRQTDVVLVSDYVVHVSETEHAKFDSFMVLVQGHMLANALLCPDLDRNQSFRNVTFYLDTPLVIRLLGLEGDGKQAAAVELVKSLQGLGGTVTVLSHIRDELERVMLGAADGIGSSYGRGAVVLEARRRGAKRSDLLLALSQVDDELKHHDVQAEPTPRYAERYQIDELDLEEVLDDEVAYYNQRAREYDINSVRCIYVRRKRSRVHRLESCVAILVTTNAAFSRAAWAFGQKHAPNQGVSSVISDFSLANICWLKSPVGASALPFLEVMAFAYAALQPSAKLLERYLREIEKLEEQQQVSDRDLLFLRSNPAAYSELMTLTLGDESALTRESLVETLERTKAELLQEHSQALAESQGEVSVLSAALRRNEKTLRGLIVEKHRHYDRLAGRALANGAKLTILLAAVGTITCTYLVIE